ncbi:MAG TPA: HEPN domain-containing protein [Thermoanaerobaculia bacterium]|nr:HEPN domain-containing protein [Thermoanaerobaculia bacterium]
MKDTTRQLLDKAEHAIRAGQILLDSDEAEFAAGRAYYAMRYVAEALLYERGMAFRKHTAVHAAFGKEFAATGLLDPKFHRWLMTASDLRLQGDYDAVARMTHEDVETRLEQARELLAAGRRFLDKGQGP